MAHLAEPKQLEIEAAFNPTDASIAKKHRTSRALTDQWRIKHLTSRCEANNAPLGLRKL